MTTYHVVQLDKSYEIVGVGTFSKGTKNVKIVPVNNIADDTAMSEITKEIGIDYTINMAMVAASVEGEVGEEGEVEEGEVEVKVGEGGEEV